jgi:DNA-binding Xre family transcriptional regulator
LNYGPYIDAAIERARLSNADVASRLSVTPDAVRKWRRGEGVKLSNLERLADALGCLVGDLLPNSGAGATSSRWAPIAERLLGLPEEEVRDHILALASVAGVMAQRRVALQGVGITARAAVSGNVTPQTTDPDSNELDYRPVGDVPDHEAAETLNAPHVRPNRPRTKGSLR